MSTHPLRTRVRRAGSRAEAPPAVAAVVVVAMIYLFLVGIGMVESGIASFGASFQDAVTAQVRNPISGLFAGLLATVLVQSSSVSTATIVGMVGSGVLPVELAIPMVMGANIGTTVTSTIAALGSIRRPDEFRRAFAGATVHDFFNLIAVAILFPIELATGLLARMATALTGVLRGSGGGTVDSPIRTVVKWPVDTLAGLVEGRAGTVVVGIVLLGIGLGLIFLALKTITTRMRRLVASGLERVINRAVSRGGGLVGILVGLVVTVTVQSSTITTSILVPLMAAGILTLPNAFPITLGANVGTTVTALLASLAVVRPEGLTIALVHTLFNLFGVLLIYPLPPIRQVPIRLAERLAAVAVRQPSMIVLYVVGVFILIPLVGLFLLP